MSDLNATRWMIKLKVAGGVGGEGIDLFLSEGLEIVANGGQCEQFVDSLANDLVNRTFGDDELQDTNKR